MDPRETRDQDCRECRTAVDEDGPNLHAGLSYVHMFTTQQAVYDVRCTMYRALYVNENVCVCASGLTSAALPCSGLLLDTLCHCFRSCFCVGSLVELVAKDLGHDSQRSAACIPQGSAQEFTSPLTICTGKNTSSIVCFMDLFPCTVL